MTDTETSSSGPGSREPARGRAGSSQDGAGSALRTERGTTTIADSVVAKIAALAAREIDGVARLGGAASGAIGGVVGAFRSDEHRTDGVAVEVGERQAAVDLSMTVRYPASIHEIAESVRQTVRQRINSMTGLEVTEVNISVTDLDFPGAEDEQEAQPPAPPRVT